MHTLFWLQKGQQKIYVHILFDKTEGLNPCLCVSVNLSTITLCYQNFIHSYKFRIILRSFCFSELAIDGVAVA